MTDHTKKIDTAFILIFIGALLLRLPNLGYSFSGDEGFSLLRDSSQLITDTEDRFRPLFFALLYLWKQLGFHGEIGLRLLPLFFGLAQIPLAYAIGNRLGDVKLARVFAVVISVSPMLIEFSQELRMYSMVAFIALLQTWLLLKLLETSRLSLWITFTGVAVAGVYTHLHYWLFLAGVAVTMWRERRALPLKPAMISIGTTFALYLLNLPHLMAFAEQRGGEYFVHLPSALPKLFAAATVGFNYFALPDQQLGRAVGVSDLTSNGPLAVLAFIPACLLLWELIRLHRRPILTVVWRCHEWFTIPVILAFLFSIATNRYWLQPKYVIFVVPFMLLFVSLALLAVKQILLRRAVAVFALTVAVAAYVHFLDPTHFGRRENWRGAAGFLEPRVTAKSSLILIPGSYRLLHYYWPESKNTAISIDVPSDPTEQRNFGERMRAELRNKSEVYYLWYDIRQNLADPRNLLLKTLDDIGYQREVLQFNPRLILYRWQLK